MISFERVERLEDRANDGLLPAEMQELADLARTTSEVQFDTYSYYTYRSLDA